MRLRTLLALFLIAGVLAACGDDAAVTTSAGATTTTAAPATTATTTTTAPATTTTAAASERYLDGDGEFAVAAFAALETAMADIRAFAEEARTGNLTEDEYDVGVHALTVGATGDAVTYAWNLDGLWLPEDTPQLEAAAAAGEAFADELDTALFYWDETWHKDYNEVGPDEVLAILDGPGADFLAAAEAALDELTALGYSAEQIEAAQADPAAVFADWDFAGVDISAAIVVGDWAWRMSEIPLFGDDQNLKVSGWVENVGDEPFDMVEFDVTLLDADGAVLETSWASMDHIVLFPGERSLVRTLGWNDSYFSRHVEEIAAVEISTPMGQVYTGYSGYRHDFDFTVEGTELWGGDNLDYWGTVTNTGDLPQESVRVIGVAFDADGNVVGWGDGGLGERLESGEWSWADWGQSIDPGGTAEYKITIRLWWPADVDRVELSAEGSDGSFGF